MDKFTKIKTEIISVDETYPNLSNNRTNLVKSEMDDSNSNKEIDREIKSETWIKNETVEDLVFATNIKSEIDDPIDTSEEISKTYSCNECDFKSTNKTNVMIHIVEGHDKNKYNSDHKTNQNSNLKRHVETVHEDIKFKCELCDLCYTQKEMLEAHVRSLHTGVMHYKCEYCNYKAKWKQSIKHHVKSVHEGTMYHQCDHCEFNATCKETVKRHVEAVHDGIRYRCDHCDFKTTFQAILKNHVQAVHGGNKCDHCDFKSAVKATLKRHVASVHDGIKYRKRRLLMEDF